MPLEVSGIPRRPLPKGMRHGPENRILESLYKYSRGKFPDGTDPNSDPAVKEALAAALNDIQNERLDADDVMIYTANHVSIETC